MNTIKLDKVIIGNRFRKDPGNVNDLMDSIEKVGLLHPIVINAKGDLIAGYRRYSAYQKLGKTSIPCTAINIENERKAEMEENTVRKDLTNSEIHAIQQHFHETESKQSEGRPKKGEEKSLSKFERHNEPPVEKTAKSTGKSTATISKINVVMDAQSDNPTTQKALDGIKEKIDDQPVDKSYKEVKKLLKPKDDQPSFHVLAQCFIDLIRRQEDRNMIFKDLYVLVKDPEGLRHLKKQLSYYQKN